MAVGIGAGGSKGLFRVRTVAAALAGQNWGHCVAQRQGNHKREQWKGTLFAFARDLESEVPAVERVFSQFPRRAKVLARSEDAGLLPAQPEGR